ncbi:hypothetical protein K457DRAFT_13046 [Linnemannia elongata AG-77]|uniref:Uncharacterized protein n=1 Tax=Linnemannia elongata AG-77 TaxID=1314771 RepID=A0A197KE87_9FUNG|nr:hypothetical protein K457DRAFT_13046 [Linnemannia elongata AG-77]
MTVAVQGFSYGPAMYSFSEQFHIRVKVEEATPACFWTNTFYGHCKLAQGVSILRATVKKVLDKSHAHQVRKELSNAMILVNGRRLSWMQKAGWYLERICTKAICATSQRQTQQYKDQIVESIDSMLGLLMCQHSMFGNYDLVLNEVDPQLVEHAFGRIKIIRGELLQRWTSPSIPKLSKIISPLSIPTS